MSNLTENEQREAVITEAMTWLRTPHHNGAALKGVGVDCGQLPLKIYSAVGLIPETETQRYSPQFAMHRSDEWYLDYCKKLGRELSEGKMPRKGDFAIYRVGRVFSHGAIVIEWPLIIHSYVGVGVTVDHGDKGWMAEMKDGSKRPIKFFTLW